MDRAVHREATPNIGVAFYGHLRALTEGMAERVQEWKAVNWRNSMREQMAQLREKGPDLYAEFVAHAQEYAKELFPHLNQEKTQQREQEIER